MYSMKEIKTKDRADLMSMYEGLLKKLYNLNVRGNDEGFKPHQYKLYKKAIARILTVLNSSRRDK